MNEQPTKPDQAPTMDDILAQAAPTTLDEIHFEYEGVRFHVYGVLHGITGGMNAEYRQCLTRTATSANGTLFAEKGLFALLREVKRPVSLCDWAVIRPWDAIGMGLRMVLLPAAWRVCTIDVLLEAVRRHDQFPRSRRMEDLGGSPFFHLLDPWTRRRMIGFPEPGVGLQHDLMLCAEPWRELWPNRPRTISGPWNRVLQIVQRHGHIPSRSLHMLSFAAEYARRTGVTEASLFVGETHNTDMAWLATHDKGFRGQCDVKRAKAYDRVVYRSRQLARQLAAKSWIVYANAIGYFASLLIGAISGLAVLATMGLIAVTTWIRLSSMR